jgi:hypothetical protein
MYFRLNGSVFNPITLQSSATSTGIGTPYTLVGEDIVRVGITGTSTSLTVAFRIVDENSLDSAILGYRISDATTSTGTTAMNEIWLFDGLKSLIGCQLKTTITAMTTGTINIAGKGAM